MTNQIRKLKMRIRAKQQTSMNKLNKPDSMNTTHQKTLNTDLVTGAPSHLLKGVMGGFTSPSVG
jgi:hypothetical protein